MCLRIIDGSWRDSRKHVTDQVKTNYKYNEALEEEAQQLNQKIQLIPPPLITPLKGDGMEIVRDNVPLGSPFSPQRAGGQWMRRW